MKEKKGNVLNVGLPKGSLQESTLHLFRKAGFNINVGSRSYVPTIDDPELSGLLIRAQEMARYVQDGILDMGLTGRDWVLEQNAKVKEVCPLLYARGDCAPSGGWWRSRTIPRSSGSGICRGSGWRPSWSSSPGAT